MRSIHFSGPRSQKGVALLTGLIILVVMTLFALNSVRKVSMEEKMTTQTYDRSLAMQVSEDALRDVEALLETNKPTPGASCATVSTVMICPIPVGSDAPRWDDDSASYWTDRTAMTAGPVSLTPKYFVEYLGNNFECNPADVASAATCRRYRITVMTQRTSGAKVLLQSVYATD